MNVALFGGTFDPIHLGHMAVARTAQQRYALTRVFFVPADIPPHKQRQPITPYHHRYAMVALATQGEKDFIPSLLEAPDVNGRSRYGANYSIDTVRRFKSQLKKSDRLFFLIGIDAFRDIATWREPEALLRECEFIVVSRPGFSLADVASSLPESMRPDDAVLKPFRHQAASGDIVLSGAVIHLLEGVKEKASATQIRQAAGKGRSLNRWLPESVVDYIKKTNLYRQTKSGAVSKQDAAPASGAATEHDHKTRLHIIQGGAAHGRRGRLHSEEK